jgi:DNA-binding CsgD family transcriptional regulator
MADKDRIYEFISAIVLDDDIATVATADTLAIANALSAGSLQELSIARGEAFRQLRARNVFVHDISPINVDGDPVAGLTVMERAVLALTLRFNLTPADVAKILGEKEKSIARYLKSARRELARTAIASALFINPTKCPVINQSMQTLGTTLNRGQILNLVSHSAECSICVPVLRTVDRQIMQNYTEAPRIAFAGSAATNVDALISRAALLDGWAPADSEKDPKKLLRRAVVLGALSTFLIVVGLLVSR